MNSFRLFSRRDWWVVLFLGLAVGAGAGYGLHYSLQGIGPGFEFDWAWRTGSGAALGLIVSGLSYGWLLWRGSGYLRAVDPYVSRSLKDLTVPQGYRRIQEELEEGHRNQGRLKTRMMTFVSRARDLLENSEGASPALSAQLVELTEDLEELTTDGTTDLEGRDLESLANNLVGAVHPEEQGLPLDQFRSQAKSGAEALTELRKQLREGVREANRLLEKMAEVFREFPVEELPRRAEQLRQRTQEWDQLARNLQEVSEALERVGREVERNGPLDREQVRDQILLQLRASDVTIDGKNQGLTPELLNSFRDRLRRTRETAKRQESFQQRARQLAQDLAEATDPTNSEETLKVPPQVDDA